MALFNLASRMNWLMDCLAIAFNFLCRVERLIPISFASSSTPKLASARCFSTIAVSLLNIVSHLEERQPYSLRIFIDIASGLTRYKKLDELTPKFLYGLGKSTKEESILIGRGGSNGPLLYISDNVLNNAKR